MELIERASAPVVMEALREDPVVLIAGPRQAGKSTLAKRLVEQGDLVRYITFDSSVERTAAQADPEGYLRAQPVGTVIDEAQRVPDVFLAIKLLVDEERLPGRFLLTGSANAMFIPGVADSLLGRMRTFTLWPLAACELSGTSAFFINQLFGKLDRLEYERVTRTAVMERALLGGFPPMLDRGERGRINWATDYLRDLIARDLRELAALEHTTALERLTRLCVSRSGQILNIADLARDSDLKYATARRYLAWLERVYLLQTVPAWHRNIGQRLIKSPKLLINDSGMFAADQRISSEQLLTTPERAGQLIETYVGNELIKQLSITESGVRLFHYRTHKGVEVDFVLEDVEGRVIGIETKATESLGSDAFKGLRHLRNQLGSRFYRGLVLHCAGSTITPFDDRLYAAPISVLW